ncbi:hypothetical protein [Maribacter sp. 2307ULW6-5]|uniref:hypothetical protein n=1 Tax=Maribacter sp. 2307ULW6-5 TaxID=3386275 RepID=UPI0039BCC0DC
MELDVMAPKRKDFFSQRARHWAKVVLALENVKKTTGHALGVTVLLKYDGPPARRAALRARWEKVLGAKTSFGSFEHPELGTIVLAGPLSELFLQAVNGKKLAELTEGPYGILRGLGLDGETAREHIRALDKGEYLLLMREEQGQRS